MLEITARQGHSLGNGHVARLAKKIGAKLVLNTDTHSPDNLITRGFALKVVRGAGLEAEDLECWITGKLPRSGPFPGESKILPRREMKILPYSQPGRNFRSFRAPFGRFERTGASKRIGIGSRLRGLSKRRPGERKGPLPAFALSPKIRFKRKLTSVALWTRRFRPS